MEKKWYQSKTLWVNVLAILAAFITDLSSYLGGDGTLTAFAILNILLRVVTKSELKFK